MDMIIRLVTQHFVEHCPEHSFDCDNECFARQESIELDSANKD